MRKLFLCELNMQFPFLCYQSLADHLFLICWPIWRTKKDPPPPHITNTFVQALKQFQTNHECVLLPSNRRRVGIPLGYINRLLHSENTKIANNERILQKTKIKQVSIDEWMAHPLAKQQQKGLNGADTSNINSPSHTILWRSTMILSRTKTLFITFMHVHMCHCFIITSSAALNYNNTANP